jgi:prepilin-type processing-associated H-X9-DG protein
MDINPPQYDGHWYGPPLAMPGTAASIARFVLNRHTEGSNYLFMDLSARKVGLKENWTLKWHQTFNTSNCWTKAGGVEPDDWPVWMRDFKDY